MPAKVRTEPQARRRYVGYLTQSLKCLSKTAQWRAGPRPDAPGSYFLETAPLAIPLRRLDDSRLYFSAGQYFKYRRPMPGEVRVNTLGYTYSLTLAPDLSGELFLWHWHPGTKPETHMHVCTRHATLGLLRRLHLPTERLAFEQVVRFLLEEMDVRPARQDWNTVLHRTEKKFRTYRTWPR